MEIAFKIANASVIPAWILLAVAPNHTITKRLLYNYLFPTLLAVGYLIFIAWGMLENAGGDGGMDSLTSLRIAFQNDKVLLAAWIHYLVFDMFVGIWINQDAQKEKLPHFLRIPILALTLFFGPIGFLIYQISKKIFHLKK